MPKPSYEIMAKGFLNVIKDYGDIMSEKAKIQSDIMANEFKSRRNFFWKMQEQDYERQNKLKFVEEMQKQFGQEQEDTGLGIDIGRPQVRVGTGGEPTLGYPSTRDKEFAIKYQQARIKKKQERNMPLSEQETRFMEMYPEIEKEMGGEAIETGVQQVKEGTMSWDELRELHPTKIDTINKIEQQTKGAQPITTKPIQQVGWLDFRRAQKDFAHMNAQTRVIAGSIKKKADLQKLIDKADKLRAAGVDVEALMDYYSDELAGF